jgi:arogenate dehydrogenase (NADP+)
MTKIGIVGLGLIGGSLAIDLKQAGYEVLGVSRRTETCDLAIARQIVDAASPEFALLSAADLVILCPPLAAMEPTAQALIPHLRPETVLTDVGSVKASVVSAIAPLWRNFVGGHPMAGTADSGLEAAFAGLFIDRPYVLTPIATTPPESVTKVEEIVKAVRSQLYHCRPEDHDQAVAWISHLPVMVSAGLIQACSTEPNTAVLKLAQQLASSGFRDTSRVGGGNPELGVMMARFNRRQVLRSLSVYRDQIDQLIQLIEAEDWQTLETMLQQTQQMRSAFVPYG